VALGKRHVFFIRTENERASNGNLFMSAGISRLRTLTDKHVYTDLFTLCVCVFMEVDVLMFAPELRGGFVHIWEMVFE
jgi:hypothetical protein